jgi:AcrR family transcriptional regulator
VSTAPPRRTRLEPDERRSQILAVARRLFSERHFSAVSTEEIAEAAGVTRGLLNHYFGTKRDLYLEVVRDLVNSPMTPIAAPGEGRSMAEVVAEAVDRWLDVVEANRGTWFAAIGAEGFGRDPDLERIVAESRDAAVELVISTLRLPVGQHAGELRAVLRSYGGLAQVATSEWLQRQSLNRPQVHALLSMTLLVLVRDILPEVAGAGP